MRIFDIRLNENILKMLMCCIINIQPNGFQDFPSATLYYMNFFVNFQTNNTKYFQMCMAINMSIVLYIEVFASIIKKITPYLQKCV